MNSLRNRIEFALAALVAVVSCQLAAAQATAPASPEPGDVPVTEKVEVAPVETATVAGPADETPKSAVSTGAGDTKRIAQRVDGASTDEIIRVTPKPKKNVYRIDNKPNRPKVTPIAVIKGPVAPWGFANRYMGGQVDRPAAKDLQGTQQGGPGGRQNPLALRGANLNQRGSQSASGNQVGSRGGRSGSRDRDR